MATYLVRIFGHDMLARVPVDQASGGQGGTDSIFVLKQPYLWSQALTVTASGSAVSSTTAPIGNHTQDQTTILRVEVADGSVIGYEVNPPGRNPQVTASVNSPRLAGANQLQFGPGWLISVIDVNSAA